MAVVLLIALMMSIVAGVLAGVFVTISFAIRREDRARTLSWPVPPGRMARSARLVTGYSRYR